MKYSILVPVHNKLEAIKKCFKTLQNQTFKNYEIIIVDDASDEETHKYLEELKEKDSRITLITNKINLGIGQTRNNLLDNANGEYIIFVDSDDYVEEDLLEKIDMELQKENLDILRFGNISEPVTPLQKEKESLKNPYRFSTPGTDTITGEEALLRWCLGSNKLNTMPWTYCIKRDLYRGVRYPITSYLEDFPITHYLLAKAKKVKAMDYIGYHYLQYDSSLTKETQKEKLELLKRIIAYTKLLLDSCSLKEETKEILFKDFDERITIREERLKENRR